MQILQIDSRLPGSRTKTKVALDGDDRNGQQAFLEAANRHRTMLSAPDDGPRLHFYTVTLYMKDETGPVWLQETGHLKAGGSAWWIGSTPDHKGLTYRQTGPLGTAAFRDQV